MVHRPLDLMQKNILLLLVMTNRVQVQAHHHHVKVVCTNKQIIP
jgi:hypothetical protein